jgi:hypothetical protein
MTSRPCTEPLDRWARPAADGMLGAMDTVLQALVVVIVVAGAVHTFASIYREKEEKRRSREAVMRLKSGVWEEPD